MTTEVNQDTQTSGSETVGRKGPLSPFLHGALRNANASLRQTGENSPEPDDATGKPSSRVKRQRTFGAAFSNQRRHRKSKRRPTTSTTPTTKSRFARRINVSRPQNGRDDAASHTAHRGPLIPTTVCSCGAPVVFTNETRCEDCYANDQGIWHGRSLNLILYKDC